MEVSLSFLAMQRFYLCRPSYFISTTCPAWTRNVRFILRVQNFLHESQFNYFIQGAERMYCLKINTWLELAMGCCKSLNNMFNWKELSNHSFIKEMTFLDVKLSISYRKLQSVNHSRGYFHHETVTSAIEKQRISIEYNYSFIANIVVH